MRRRAFIEGIAALATAWPFAVRAQQSTTMRRVGVLMNYRADEPEGQDAGDGRPQNGYCDYPHSDGSNWRRRQNRVDTDPRATRQQRHWIDLLCSRSNKQAARINERNHSIDQPRGPFSQSEKSGIAIRTASNGRCC